MRLKQTYLHELGKKHNTDKHDKEHTHCEESYLHVYEHYFDFFRDKPINFLELGVKRGGSLRLWKEYFPKAQIYGVDLNPACKAHESDRIHIHIASQDDEVSLLNLSKEVGGFDIILDDASHINDLTIASFNILYDKCLKKGGLYLIEDLGNSYVNLEIHAGRWDGELIANKNRGTNLSHERKDLDDLFKSLIKEIDLENPRTRMVHFWSKIAIIGKG